MGKLIWAAVWQDRYACAVVRRHLSCSGVCRVAHAFISCWIDWTRLATQWPEFTYQQRRAYDWRDGNQNEEFVARGATHVFQSWSIQRRSSLIPPLKGILWQDTRRRIWFAESWWSRESTETARITEGACRPHQAVATACSLCDVIMAKMRWRERRSEIRSDVPDSCIHCTFVLTKSFSFFRSVSRRYRSAPTSGNEGRRVWPWRNPDLCSGTFPLELSLILWNRSFVSSSHGCVNCGAND